MELLQLKYFCDAAQTENFSKTAARFFVPTSNISQTVKRLEVELGVSLFDRRSNRVVLAEAGKRFYEKASAALALLEDARAEASFSHEISGEIKLLIFCNRRVVTQAIERFKAEHPNVNFILRHEREADLDCDVLIWDVCPVGYEEYGVLVEEDILLALNREHPLASRENISIADLSGERFITMPRGSSLYSVTSDLCRGAGFLPNITIQTDDPQYIRKYVQLGLGIAFVPAYSWEGLFSQDVVLKKVGSVRRKTLICIPKSKGKSAAVEGFLTYLQADAQVPDCYSN